MSDSGSERTRVVVELEAGGRGIPERRGPTLAAQLSAVLSRLGDRPVVFTPLVQSVTEPQLDRLRSRAAALARVNDEPFVPTDWMFGGFFAVELPAAESAALVADLRSLLALSLSDLPGQISASAVWVETYDRSGMGVVGGLGDPPASYSPRDLVGDLGPATSLPGIRGGHPGISLAIVESSWRLDHENLIDDAIRPLTPPDPPDPPDTCDNAAHGVATLGMMVDRDGGLIPEVEDLVLLSPTGPCGDRGLNWANTVLRGAVELDPGGVLLLELQTRIELEKGFIANFPPEVFPAVARAIGLASRAGIVVVEPTGNSIGNHVVVGFEDGRVRKLLSDGQLTEWIGKDSGALLVGAKRPFPACKRVTSNRGREVAIFAPGNCIRTSGWLDTGATDATQFSSLYTGSYGNTSAASAIVAGATVAVQAVRLSHRKSPLLPGALKQLIRSGTKGGGGLGIAGGWTFRAFVEEALALP